MYYVAIIYGCRLFFRKGSIMPKTGLGMTVEDVTDADYVAPPPTRSPRRAALTANPLAVDWDEIEATANEPSSPPGHARATAAATPTDTHMDSTNGRRRVSLQAQKAESRTHHAKWPQSHAEKPDQPAVKAWAENAGTQTPPQHHSARTPQPKKHDTSPPRFVPLVSPQQASLDARRRMEATENWRRAWDKPKPRRAPTHAEREKMRREDNSPWCGGCCVM